eukprot:Pgem_evm1s12328
MKLHFLKIAVMANAITITCTAAVPTPATPAIDNHNSILGPIVDIVTSLWVKVDDQIKKHKFDYKSQLNVTYFKDPFCSEKITEEIIPIGKEDSVFGRDHMYLEKYNLNEDQKQKMKEIRDKAAASHFKKEREAELRKVLDLIVTSNDVNELGRKYGEVRNAKVAELNQRFNIAAIHEMNSKTKYQQNKYKEQLEFLMMQVKAEFSNAKKIGKYYYLKHDEEERIKYTIKAQGFPFGRIGMDYAPQIKEDGVSVSKTMPGEQNNAIVTGRVFNVSSGCLPVSKDDGEYLKVATKNADGTYLYYNARVGNNINNLLVFQAIDLFFFNENFQRDFSNFSKDVNFEKFKQLTTTTLVEFFTNPAFMAIYEHDRTSFPISNIVLQVSKSILINLKTGDLATHKRAVFDIVYTWAREKNDWTVHREETYNENMQKALHDHSYVGKMVTGKMLDNAIVKNMFFKVADFTFSATLNYSWWAANCLKAKVWYRKECDHIPSLHDHISSMKEEKKVEPVHTDPVPSLYNEQFVMVNG